jgi:glycerol-3-phosphate acyltransferase PlsY
MGDMELYRNIGLIIICYLVGAIPFCNIIARLAGKKDLREIGDKNPGGWNLAFNVSKYWGILGMILDVSKGYFSYFVVLNITDSLVVALLAGCAAVAGHNYSPYLKFSGGKGLGTTLGFLLAVHPLSIIAFAIGILSGLFIIKNMIWGVFLGLAVSHVFLWLYNGSYIYLIMLALLLLIIIPKYINRTMPFGQNFKFRKEKTFKDLFTPKIR